VAATAALSAVPPADIGKASGVNSTLQRFGSVFAVAFWEQHVANYPNNNRRTDVGPSRNPRRKDQVRRDELFCLLVAMYERARCVMSNFGIAPLGVGLAQSAPQQISEGHPILKG